MTEKHAVLSASSAYRWITCPGSVGLSRSIPKGGSSSYAEEGTWAHALAELHASVAFGKITSRQFNGRYNKWLKTTGVSAEQANEMAPHVMAYVAFLKERMAVYDNSVLMLEQRLPSGIEDCWGTSDSVIVSPEHVEIVDFKYGSGTIVVATDNPQLKIYALGALDEYGDMLGETQTVILSIFQPRTEYGSSTWSLGPDELRAWREEIRPIAQAALAGSDEFHPSEAACHYCPAAGVCRARMEEATATDFGTDPALLTPEEIGELLPRLTAIREWCNALDQAALEMSYSQGIAIPGWKVILSGGRRVVEDEAGAVARLTELGYEIDEIVNSKIKGIGDLEKLLGKVEFAEELGAYITRTTGRPSMVPESDGRPSISPGTEAAKDFAEDLL